MNHDVELNVQIWKQMKPHLIGGDIDEAALDFVSTLMEHGIAAEDLASYALDQPLRDALREYAGEEVVMLDEFADEDFDDFDEWD